MNRKTSFVSILLLCMIVLSACASANPASTGSTTTDNNNSQVNQTLDSAGAAKVNLNTASADDFLATVPGLGNRMVREFMEYRPYLSIRQFRQEIGKYVDDTQVAEYEKYVYVPIAINDSDAETLQQIPGLSPEEAESLIAARPFESADAFLTRLSEYISADELEIARMYLGGN